MKYLILGGGGFQGRHLAERLIAEGEQVRIFDRNPFWTDSSSQVNEFVEWISGDFISSKDIERAVDGVSVIFHLVSTTLPKTSNDDPINDVMTNVIPTIKLLEAALRIGVKKIIFFSSGGTVYGIPKLIPTPENHQTMPLCSYGIHKVAIENYLHMFYELYGLDYAVMRLSNPYGSYQKPGRAQGVIPVFLQKMMNDEVIEIWGDGTVVRDYIHVDDVVEAAVKLVEYQGLQKIFNIGSGIGLSLNEVISEIEDLVEKNAKINYLQGRPLDVPINVLDIKLASNELGWYPKIYFRDGLNQLIRNFQV